MTCSPPVPHHVLEALRQMDTCAVSDAIETLKVRTRNEGFVSGAVKCQFPRLPPMVGYAATARVRTSTPPASAPPIRGGCYHDRMDWWTWLASLPEPRVMVIEDGEHAPGIGAFVGQIHVALARALNCVGCVTNGAVRDLDTIEKLTFPVFAGSIAVSHSYAHVVEFGIPVSIGGVVIHPADLIHGDRNGVHVIPLEIAEQVPGIAQRLRAEDNALIQFCAASDFSLQEFSRRVQSMSRDQPSLSFESDPAAPE